MSATVGAGLPASLYRDTANPSVPTPPLTQDKLCDVAIVGGGFTGLSTALHLRQLGVDAVVLEAQEPGWGASGRNGGQVNPGLKAEPDEIERTFGPELGGRMIALSGGAPDLVFRLVREHAIDCAAAQTGTLRAAFAPGDADTIKRTAEAWATRSLPIQYLDRDEMARATGTDRYLNGVIDRRGGTLNPLSYARGLAGAVLRAGGTIHGQTHVSSTSRQDGRWQLKTPGGTVSADWVVLATNGYTDDLWPGLRQTVVPVFSGIVASDPLDEELRARILPERPAVYEIGSITTYYRVDDGGRLLMGGRSVLRSAEGPDTFSSLGAYAHRLWPGLSNQSWSHGWNGRIAITRDHYPHLHEPAPTVIAALGYNGRGVAMATAMGAEIARRIAGTPASELAMPVTDLKPFPLHGLWPIGAAARIAYGRLLDKLKL